MKENRTMIQGHSLIDVPKSWVTEENWNWDIQKKHGKCLFHLIKKSYIYHLISILHLCFSVLWSHYHKHLHYIIKAVLVFIKSISYSCYFVFTTFTMFPFKSILCWSVPYFSDIPLISSHVWGLIFLDCHWSLLIFETSWKN